MELKDLRSYKRLTEIDSKLAGQVESVYNAVLETINSISGCYNNYTMHDMSHGLRVATYMEDLAFGIDEDFDENMADFNGLELALLILSAILHDIGMFIRPEDKENIKKNNIKYTNSLTFTGVLNVVNQDEDEAVKEVVRITHAQRINEYIDYDFGGKTISSMLMLDDKYPYAEDVVKICVGHGENYDYLKRLRNECTKGKYTFNLQYIAALLRIADYLDLDKQRTPVLWYKIMRIEGFSKDEWEKHFIIHNEKKLKTYINNKMQIFFEGRSSSANIHRKYLKYIDELKLELENADSLLNTKDTQKKYEFNIVTKIDDCVTTLGFKYSDLRLNLDYSAITELLMGKNIYGDHKLGLRELVQNSIDACNIMGEIQTKDSDYTIEPQIYITYSKDRGYVKIKDTGIGMTLDVVKKHFLNIGKSYYKSNEYIYEDFKYKPIGQYGIGFLACFLLSNNVIVKTKYYKCNEINQIELEKNSEYVVTNTEETGTFFGTEIILDYDKFFEVFSDEIDVKTFLEKYFYTNIPIRLKNEDKATTIEISNCCESLINNQIEKEAANGKYEDIVCENYSDNIEGVIKALSTQRKKTFEIRSMNDKFYYFNNKTNKFENSIPNSDGYYRLLEYYLIDNNDYESISKTRKSNKNKRKEICSISNQKIFLIINQADDLEYTCFDDTNFQFCINNTTEREIFENSNLPYYDELLDEYSYYIPIFKSGNEYINLQECSFSSRYYKFMENYSPEFFFYNKGVYIRRYRDFVCYIPCALKVGGFINYKNHGIKLDVSRNFIIENTHLIQNELSCILLEHIKRKNSDPKIENIIDKMIEYNVNNLQKPIQVY